HTWSLAVEEQFYIVFPLFMMIAWRKGRTIAMALVSIIAVISLLSAQLAGNLNFHAPFVEPDMQWFSQPAWASFYLPVGRAWELMLGALGAFYLRAHGPLRAPAASFGAWLGLFAIGFAVMAFGPSTPTPSVYTLIPTLGALALIICAVPGGAVTKLLALPPLVGLGLISYSVYLFHQPLFAFARLASLDEPGPLTYITLTAVAIVLGYLSWYFVEQPCRDNTRVSRRQVVTIAATISVALLSIGFAGHLGAGLPGRLPEAAQRILAAGGEWNALPANCDPGRGPYSPPAARCTVGAADVAPSVVIFGDSHARVFAPGFGEAAAKSGLSAKVLVHSGCLPVAGLRSRNEPIDPCPARVAEMTRYLREHPELTHIVLMARWTLAMEETRFDDHEGGLERGPPVHLIPVHDPVWLPSRAERQARLAKAYRNEINGLIALGRVVFLVYPTPEMGRNVRPYLARLAMANEHLDAPLSSGYRRFLIRNERTIAALDAVGTHANLTRIHPAQHFCNTFVPERCVAEHHGVPLYFDNHHLSVAGARFIAEEIVTRITEAP
ncbi:MAG: hypothetical protein ACI8PT_004722, partial [Gammaproteobacteria bacterium]